MRSAPNIGESTALTRMPPLFRIADEGHATLQQRVLDIGLQCPGSVIGALHCLQCHAAHVCLFCNTVASQEQHSCRDCCSSALWHGVRVGVAGDEQSWHTLGLKYPGFRRASLPRCVILVLGHRYPVRGTLDGDRTILTHQANSIRKDRRTPSSASAAWENVCT